MSGVSFTPTFHHTDWVDNVDRVQAGGPVGFNIRFRTLEADLGAVSTAVGKLDAAIAALSVRPPAKPTSITLSPALVPVSPSPGWSHDPTGVAVRPQGAANVSGLMTVPLPDQVRLLSLRALGTNTGATAIVRVSLLRAPLVAAGGAAPDRIVRVSPDTNPFDRTDTITDQNLARVNLSQFRYFLLATVDNAVAADVITLTGFQISYIAD
ncbi:hypothetical protein BX286_6254 [Streptomyces sp. 3211.6]|uniref:hypothetical protein n=1 Tax=Streptomyces sp. 3211.6 TaxID=1938845 RepID=UPI000EB59C59|nr:hypothetical protein [Streptomyces sp. 3211.6]RKT08170.1 hypothetical protein BX286_6254 [Streptomyces sp. 3211.6]